jgi:8-amino-7-oxononanoate synthase
MMTAFPSLLAYSQKRFRLAGKAILEEHNPWFMPLDGLRAQIEARGESLISFANYDYLGLAGHEAVKNAAHDAIDRHNLGALGSRLVGGERLIHTEFEKAIAEFVGAEACMTLVSGYLTNSTLISHLLGNKDLLIIDELCHSSIMSGAKGAHAVMMTFEHNDLDQLEHLLKTHRTSYRNCLIVVEGLYSMDGDLPDLPKLLSLKDQYQAWLLVDEAHSFGVLGDRGRGIAEHFGEDPNRIDLIVGTLSKALVSCGGFLCARKEIIDWLRFTLSGFVYSVGLSPVITAAAHEALRLIASQPQRTARLRLVSELFLRKARSAHLNTGTAIGRGIVPIMFPDIHSTLRASAALLDANIFAPPIVHVGVPKNAPRIRFFLSAAHEAQHLDQAISVLRAQVHDVPPPELAPVDFAPNDVNAGEVVAVKVQGRSW